MPAPKQPFERIISLVDRKKILNRLITDSAELYLKHTDGNLSILKCRSLSGDADILGDWMTENMKSPTKSLVAFFYANKERYFFKTSLVPAGNSWKLNASSQFYRLNRRNHYRIDIPSSVRMTFYIQTVGDTDISKPVRVLDFSAGGIRIAWKTDKKLGKGTPIRGVLQWDSEKMLPVDGNIIHSVNEDEYGIKFSKLTPVAQNRLKMWAIELQQIALFK